MKDEGKRPIRRGGRAPADKKPVVVKNKDIIVLAQVLYIMASVCNAERRREWQKERMYNITQHYSGMPGSGGGVPAGLDATFAAIAEIDEEHAEKLAEYVKDLKAAEAILNDIESQTMRTFVEMKYVMDIPNQEIMRELNMTDYGFKQAKKAIEQAEDMKHVDWKERFILEKSL